ncbi:MAG: globin [Pseudomonadota bacterium]
MPNYDDIFAMSFDRVLHDGAYSPALISDFYKVFLAASPDVADKFAQTDMAAQRTMLHDSLNTLVDFFRTRVPSPQLQKLAEIHSRGAHDIPPAYYDIWLNSLVTALSRHDPEFNEAVELAWRIALAPGITYMRFAY